MLYAILDKECRSFQDLKLRHWIFGFHITGAKLFMRLVCIQIKFNLSIVYSRIALQEGLSRGWFSYTDLMILSQDLKLMTLSDLAAELSKVSSDVYEINLKKVLRKHSLHEENSSLGIIEAVHQWK